MAKTIKFNLNNALNLFDKNSSSGRFERMQEFSRFPVISITIQFFRLRHSLSIIQNLVFLRWFDLHKFYNSIILRNLRSIFLWSGCRLSDCHVSIVVAAISNQFTIISVGYLYRSRQTSSDKRKPEKNVTRMWTLLKHVATIRQLFRIWWHWMVFLWGNNAYILPPTTLTALWVPQSIHCINPKWFFCNKFNILIHSLYGYLMSAPIKDAMIIFVCYFNMNKFQCS